VIHCCICLQLGKKTEATVVVKGYSVCEHHQKLAARPDFDIFKMRGNSTMGQAV
jgi:hypothetical protein